MAKARQRRKKRKKSKPIPSSVRSRLPGWRDQDLIIPLLRNRNKMSERLLDLADPLLRDWRDEKDIDLALRVASLAWNIALLPEDEWKTAMEGLLEDEFPSVPQDTLKYLQKIIMTMSARKRLMFPDDERLVLSNDYEITERGQFNLTTSYFEPGEPPDRRVW